MRLRVGALVVALSSGVRAPPMPILMSMEGFIKPEPTRLPLIPRTIVSNVYLSSICMQESWLSTSFQSHGGSMAGYIWEARSWWGYAPDEKSMPYCPSTFLFNTDRIFLSA